MRGGRSSRWVLALLVAKAVLLSAHIYGISGDGHYYIARAEAFLEEGTFPPPGRAPWFVLFLAGGLSILGREGLPPALAALQLALDAAVVYTLIAHAEGRLAGSGGARAVVEAGELEARRPSASASGHGRYLLGLSAPGARALLVAAFVIQPFTGARATYVLTESLTTALLFFGICLSASGLSLKAQESRPGAQARASSSSPAANPSSWSGSRSVRRVAVGALLAGGAAVLRQELAPVVVLALLAMLWVAKRRRSFKEDSGAPGLFREARAAAIALALVAGLASIPHVIARAQRVTHGIPPHDGFGSWMTSWFATYAEYKRIYWPFPGRMPPLERLPDRAFDSDEERARVGRLIELHGARGATEELRAGFEAIANERKTRSPLRHYLLLPLARSLHYWVNPAYLGAYARAVGLEGGLWLWILSIPTGLSKLVLLGLGAVGLLALRRGRDARLPLFDHVLLAGAAVLLVGRTLEMAALGTLWSAGLMEPRYMTVVFPFLLFSTTVAVTGRRRGGLGPGF